MVVYGRDGCNSCLCKGMNEMEDTTARSDTYIGVVTTVVIFVGR